MTVDGLTFDSLESCICPAVTSQCLWLDPKFRWDPCWDIVIFPYQVPHTLLLNNNHCLFLESVLGSHSSSGNLNPSRKFLWVCKWPYALSFSPAPGQNPGLLRAPLSQPGGPQSSCHRWGAISHCNVRWPWPICVDSGFSHWSEIFLLTCILCIFFQGRTALKHQMLHCGPLTLHFVPCRSPDVQTGHYFALEEGNVGFIYTKEAISQLWFWNWSVIPQ